ncbi:MAG: lytic transglycosylase domain-containing protein [Thermodesulfobacteriota bacterium]
MYFLSSKGLRVAEKVPQQVIHCLAVALLALMVGMFSASRAQADPEGGDRTRAQVFEKSDRLAENETEGRYMEIIIAAAERYGVDPALITAVIKAESEFNPRAVSHRGARGLMQLMPGTARALGVENSFNPEHNIHGGTKYMKQLLDQFDGKVNLALAAYNAGSRKVRKYQGVPPYKVTRSYIRKVFLYYEDYKRMMEGYPNRS